MCNLLPQSGLRWSLHFPAFGPEPISHRPGWASGTRHRGTVTRVGGNGEEPESIGICLIGGMRQIR